MTSPIKPYLPRPHFWEYKGSPLRLLGGSVEDNLFQIASLETHLDLLASCGGNYVRCTMSSRDEGDVWPYRSDPGSGKYDLNQSNPEYWQRFTSFLDWTFQRDIIVQIECWDRFDFSREVWQKNPFNPRNNVNYSYAQAGLAENYPDHPNANQQPFFYTVPELKHNSLLLEYQQAFIERMLSISLSYPHVLYCMDNETSGSPAWGAYWATFIKARASSAGVQVFTTEMWDPWDITHPVHEATFSHPELYDFVDISQNNHIVGEAHWDRMQVRWNQLASQSRPMNMVKIYGADGNKFGHTDRDGMDRFWRGLLGGVAGLRFHRPPSGLGLSPKAQACLRSARMLLAEWDWLKSTPDSDHHLLNERVEDGAYLSYIPSQQYVVFFPQPSRVRLDLRQVANRFEVRWLDILASAWSGEDQVQGGDWLDLQPPGSGPCAVLLTASAPRS